MKTGSRKFKFCMFCGKNENRNREHFFGPPVAEAFPKQKIFIPKTKEALTSSRLKDDKCFWRKDGNALSLTSFCLCKDCNEALGADNSAATKLVIDLFKGRAYDIEPEHQVSLIRYFQRIGILMDLEASPFDPNIMDEARSDVVFNQNYKRVPILLSSEDRKIFRTGHISPKIRIFLGKYGGKHGTTYPMNIATLGARDRFRNHIKAMCWKKFAFIIDRKIALICIGNCDDSSGKLTEIRQRNQTLSISKLRVSREKDFVKNMNEEHTFPDGTILKINR